MAFSLGQFLCGIYLLLLQRANPFTSPVDREYPTTLSELLEQSESTDHAIYGNPLLYPECSNAVLDGHTDNLETLLIDSGIPTPWFWSRETLDATIKSKALHRRLKVTSKHAPQLKLTWSTATAYEYGRNHKYLPHHIVRWFHRLGNTTENVGGNLTFHTEYVDNAVKLAMMNDKEYMQNLPEDVHYYHVEKSGSSSMGGTLNKFGKFNRSYLSENVVTHSDCGFTFVREPISRFISGYYTVNKLIFMHNKYALKPYDIPKRFSFYNITGEPQRVLEFIRNLMEYRYEFLVTSPLEHIMSQASILSVAQVDIHFVGRLKKFKPHLDLVTEHCAGRFLPEIKELMQRMAGFGTNQLDEEPDYAKMMGLEEWESGDLLPAAKAIADNYWAYQALVEYFKQDFTCFGYEYDFQAFREKINAKMKDNTNVKKRLLENMKNKNRRKRPKDVRSWV